MANTTSTLKRKLRKSSLINLATTVASFLVSLFETVTSGCQLRASGTEKEGKRPAVPPIQRAVNNPSLHF